MEEVELSVDEQVTRMGPAIDDDRRPLISRHDKTHVHHNDPSVNDFGDDGVAVASAKSLHMRKASWINTSVILLALIMVRPFHSHCPSMDHEMNSIHT